MKKDVYNLGKPQETVSFPEETSRGSSKTKKISLDVSKEFFKDVETISKINDVSSYSVFLACLYVLLYKYTYQNNLKINLKKSIDLDKHFSDFVKSVHETTQNTISNQLHEFLTFDRDSFSLSVLFTYKSLSDNALTALESASEFDLNFEVLPSSEVLNLEFNTNLFKPDFAKSLLSHYFFVLKQILKDENCKLSNIQMMTSEEHRLLEKFNKKGISLNDDAFLSLLANDNQSPCVYILDDNLKHVPIGNIRFNIYFWK